MTTEESIVAFCDNMKASLVAAAKTGRTIHVSVRQDNIPDIAEWSDEPLRYTHGGTVYTIATDLAAFKLNQQQK